MAFVAIQISVMSLCCRMNKKKENNRNIEVIYIYNSFPEIISIIIKKARYTGLVENHQKNYESSSKLMIINISCNDV